MLLKYIASRQFLLRFYEQKMNCTAPVSLNGRYYFQGAKRKLTGFAALLQATLHIVLVDFVSCPDADDGADTTEEDAPNTNAAMIQ